MCVKQQQNSAVTVPVVKLEFKHRLCFNNIYY